MIDTNWKEQERRMYGMTQQAIDAMVKESPTPPAMFAMGVLSDAQEMFQNNMINEGNRAINMAKYIIDEYCSKKDEHGRHIK